MKKTASLRRNGGAVCDRLDIRELGRQLDNWLYDGEAQNCTKATLANRGNIADRLRRFVQQQECAEFGRAECRAFLAYLNAAHERADARWANSRYARPLRPSSVKTCHKRLRAFLNFCVEEGVLDASPLEGLPAPIARHDQIQPFSRLVKVQYTQKRRETPLFPAEESDSEEQPTVVVSDDSHKVISLKAQ